MLSKEESPKIIIRCDKCGEPLLEVLSSVCICLRDGYIKCMNCGQRIVLQKEYDILNDE